MRYKKKKLYTLCGRSNFSPLGSYFPVIEPYSQCLSCNPSLSPPPALPSSRTASPHPDSCPAVCQGKARCRGCGLSSKAPRACPECPATQMPQSSGSETPGPTSSRVWSSWFCRLHTMMKPSLKVDVACHGQLEGGESLQRGCTPPPAGEARRIKVPICAVPSSLPALVFSIPPLRLDP